MVVKAELENLGFNKALVELGEVKIKEVISAEQLKQLDKALRKSGFELIDEQKGLLIGKIKETIVEVVHYSDEQVRRNFPDYLSRKLNQNYASLESLFFEVKNTTIENFFIAHKIERVKELLVYYNLNLSEIAYQLNYSSVAQLSGQFKELTGFPPSHFQKLYKTRHSKQMNV